MSHKPLGRFSWHELMTPDPDSARDFYSAITGWSTGTWDAGGKPYEMWMNGGHARRRADGPPRAGGSPVLAGLRLDSRPGRHPWRKFATAAAPF